jgi:hypothetical protein
LNKKQRYLSLLEQIHFPLWIIKDFSWFIALNYEATASYFKYFSLLFAIPTISISLYLIFTEKRTFFLFGHVLLAVWLLANTLWMVTELFYHEVKIVSLLFFSMGAILIPFFTVMVVKDFKKTSQHPSE